MGILRTKRGKAIFGGALGIFIIAGVALAALLFSSIITGQTTFDDENTDYTLAVEGTDAAEQMNCSDIATTANQRDVVFNPKLARSDLAGTAPVIRANQFCTVTFTVTNTGDVTLRVINMELNGPGAAGLRQALMTQPPTIAPGASAPYVVRLYAGGPNDGTATGGALSGKLNLQTNS